MTLVALWDLLIDVPKQNGEHWNKELAETHDDVLVNAWDIILTMEDEINTYKEHDMTTALQDVNTVVQSLDEI